jgi:hypothetical protein
MHDLPAYAYLAGYGTSGKFGCPNCAEHTSSKWLKKGRKYCYMGHRHWLPINHAFRRKKQPFYEDVEHRTAPEISSGTAVLAKLRGRTFILGKLNKKSNVATNPKKKKEKQKRKRSGEGESSNTRGGEGMSSEDSNKEKDPKNWWKKESIFFKLPYWEFLKLRHNLDVMHIEKKKFVIISLELY